MPGNHSGDADVNGSFVEVDLTSDDDAQGNSPGENHDATADGDARQGGGRRDRRIASVTYKWRESERRRIAAETRLARLEGNYSSQQKQREEDERRQGEIQRLASYEGHVADLDRRVSDAAKSLQQAEERGEENAVVLAREVHIEAVAERRAAKAEVARKRAELEAAPAPKREPAAQAGSKDPMFDAWRATNPWFDSNPTMRAVAMDAHNRIKTEGKIPVGSDAYYREIDGTVMDKFPDAPEFSDDPEPVRAAPLGDGGDARADRDRPSRVRLTAEQVTAAKRMGVPLKDYARNLAQSAKG